MTTTQQHLNQFYVELQAWIDGGCGEHPVFYDADGICNLARDWALVAGLSDDEIGEALIASFEIAGRDTLYPFNDSGDDWQDEVCRGYAFTNPARLAWIKAHADAAKAAGQEAA